MKINKCDDCQIEFIGNVCPVCDKIIEDKKKDPIIDFLSEAG
ncbi:MAG: hypothetical protein AABY15_08020 [Nanoarchaeota archaeon]